MSSTSLSLIKKSASAIPAWRQGNGQIEKPVAIYLVDDL
jgi:hypothetical protein